jgi:hypothetical protein
LNHFNKLYTNSMLSFIAAFIITTIIHEGGHFIAYLFLGAKPVMYHNYVITTDHTISNSVKIIAALAGPVTSLIQGIIFWILIKNESGRNGYTLTGLWLCLFGFINFFGYLMLTPLSTEGDTGKAAQLLQIPYPVKIFIAVLGLTTIILLVRKIAKHFSNFTPDQITITVRRKYINNLILFPIITGSIVNSLLAFPLPSILSVIYPATSAYVILSAYGVILKAKNGIPGNSVLESEISIPIIWILLSAFIVKSLLSGGVSL